MALNTNFYNLTNREQTILDDTYGFVSNLVIKIVNVLLMIQSKTGKGKKGEGRIERTERRKGREDWKNREKKEKGGSESKIFIVFLTHKEFRTKESHAQDGRQSLEDGGIVLGHFHF